VTAVFAAPIIPIGGRVVGWSTFPDRLNLRDEVEIGGTLWRVSYIHQRSVERACGGLRLEVIEVRVSPAKISRRDNAILALANRDLSPGQMANGILLLGMSDTTYHQRLNQLLDDPEIVEAALVRYPLLVNRLRRLRAGRRRHLLGADDG
jgi:Protein of unknown function (DUF3263)